MTKPWRPLAMLGLASLLMNMTSGTAYAGYGVLMRHLTEEFEVSRSTVSLGASIIALTSALAAPLSGRLIDRWSLRKTAMLGCVIGAIGMSLAASASHFIIFLIGFSVLGGLANSFSGSLPSSSLVARWLPHRTGLAVAICMLPLAVTVGPPLFSALTEAFGWRSLALTFVGTYLLMLLLANLIRDYPAGAAPRAGEAAARAAAFKTRLLLRDKVYWCLVVSAGVQFGTSIALISHVVSAAVEFGVGQTRAALLVSVIGISGACGGLIIGWLADRIGPAQALTCNAAATAMGWLLLGFSNSFATMVPGVFIIGFCGGGSVVSPLAAYIAQTYGKEVFGRVFGLLKQLTLPILFASPLLVGVLYDASGSYRLPFLCVAALSMVATVLLLPTLRARKVAVAAPAG